MRRRIWAGGLSGGGFVRVWAGAWFVVMWAASAWAATVFPGVSDLPRQPELPDPLTMLDGRPVTTRDMWLRERRPELLRLFQHYMYGSLPPKPAEVEGRVERSDASALGGKATLREVTISFGASGVAPIHLLLVIPQPRSAPAPVVLAMNYFGNQTLLRDPRVRMPENWMPERGAGVVANRATESSRGTWAEIWRIEEIVDRGYAVATFYNGDVDPDTPDQRGLPDRFPQVDPADTCGTIAAWAWGLQRAVDVLVTVPELDPRRIVVTGHSRLGKAALLAAAFDERIALAIPHQAGCGGSAPSRAGIALGQPYNTLDTAQTKRPETVADLNDKFPHWFNARFKEFDSQPDRLPFDQHCLVALCAPRPVLFTNGRSDTWINPAGQFEVLRAAAPVYRLLGAGDFAAPELPPDGRRIDGVLGYSLRPGGHSLLREDWRVFLDFADRHLGRVAADQDGKEGKGGRGGEGEGEGESGGRLEEAGTLAIPRWSGHEFSLTGRSTAANPFAETTLVGEFRSPSGKVLRVDGFYDGAATWRLRFAPDEEGEWSYRLYGEGVALEEAGRFRCTVARGHGFVRVHPQNPYAFAYDDGTPFFPMGDTCYGLHDDTPITPALREEYLRIRRAQHFNFVRMSVSHSVARSAAEPARYWPWGGTPDRPDLDTFNPEFFQGFDELMRLLQSSGMKVELLLLNFYRPPFTDPSAWTPAREARWLRYLLSRYGAFDHVFLWTIANEYETHPDGRYRLDFPDDVDWVRTTARFLKSQDPYRHLVTVHPVISASRQGPSPRSPIDPPWRIGEFFGAAAALDVLSQQTGALGDGLVWDQTAQCWNGDPTNLVRSLRADRRYRKPVLNSENGYEYLRGYPTGKRQVHHTDKVRRTAWRIVCSGGYFAAGFQGTLGHSDAWNQLDAPQRYTFSLHDEGAPRQLGVLYEFFAALPYWRMEPLGEVSEDQVVLGDRDEVGVVYRPHGGVARMPRGVFTGPVVAHWFDPRSGNLGETRELTVAELERGVAAPDGDDWALLVRRARGRARALDQETSGTTNGAR